jgi:hypothetical protein
VVQEPSEHRRRPSLAATSPELVGNLASPVRIFFLALTPSDQNPKDQDRSLTEQLSLDLVHPYHIRSNGCKTRSTRKGIDQSD